MTLNQFIRAINVHIECQIRITLSQCRVNESVFGRYIFFVVLVLGTGKGVGRSPNKAVVHTRSNMDKLYGTHRSAVHIVYPRVHKNVRPQPQTAIEPVMQIHCATSSTFKPLNILYWMGNYFCGLICSQLGDYHSNF